MKKPKRIRIDINRKGERVTLYWKPRHNGRGPNEAQVRRLKRQGRKDE
jgi:hypothetical protein